MINCPILNPIKFYKTLPDFNTTFPNMDNVTQRTMYVEGLQPGQWYKEWKYGKDLILQFEHISSDDTNLTVYKYDSTTETFVAYSISIGTGVTPAGWEGNNFLKHTLNLIEGTYYLAFSDGYRSDVFVVTNSLQHRKKFVEISYTHTENDFGAILIDQVFYNYFCGQLILGNPENEISGFESDRGNMIKLSATPKRIATLNINEVHYTYVDHINLIFSCDTIVINGITYENTEPPTIEDIDFSDLKNITIKLTQTNNNYYYGR